MRRELAKEPGVLGRRTLLLGAGAALATAVWTRKDLTARLFNPLSLDRFALDAAPGLAAADGRPLPGFSAADLEGRRTILNFWASWCPSCREEHQLLVEFSARSPAPIFGAAVRDDPDHARDFLARNGNPYAAVGMDSRGHLQRALGARGVPTTFVIGPGPRIELALQGPLDAQILATRLLPALTRAA